MIESVYHRKMADSNAPRTAAHRLLLAWFAGEHYE
jgi:hypothetical protein